MTVRQLEKVSLGTVLLAKYGIHYLRVCWKDDVLVGSHEFGKGYVIDIGDRIVDRVSVGAVAGYGTCLIATLREEDV